MSEELIAARRAWARRYLQMASDGPLPEYGSEAWRASPPAVQVASCVQAAEAWATDGDRLEQRVEDFSREAWQAHKRAEDAEWRAEVDEHRSRWSYLSRCNWPGAYAGQGEPRPLGEALREYVDQRQARREGGAA